LAAIPAAFLVSALIGMLIERTVIRPFMVANWKHYWQPLV
jgi:branched-subunit amino acid ABC-type transport system permease component